MFESPTLDMANTFANTANLMLCSIFYQPIFPMAIPIATVGLACQYWTFKASLSSINGIIVYIFEEDKKTRADVNFDARILRQHDSLYCFHVVNSPHLLYIKPFKRFFPRNKSCFASYWSPKCLWFCWYLFAATNQKLSESLLQGEGSRSPAAIRSDISHFPD